MKARHKHLILGLVVLTTMLFVSVGMSATLVAPANTTAADLSGTAKVGQTLTAGDRHVEQHAHVVCVSVAAL